LIKIGQELRVFSVKTDMRFYHYFDVRTFLFCTICYLY